MSVELSREQASLGLSAYRNYVVRSGASSTQGVLRMYLGGDGADKETLMEREVSTCCFDCLDEDSLQQLPVSLQELLRGIVS